MPLKKSGSNEYLSSSALDYYNRFAKNRGLEKYFRNSKVPKPHRASSETCLNAETTETENISSEFAKSLTNLRLSDCEINKSQPNLVDSTEFTFERHAIVAHKSVDATTPVKESSAMTEELTTDQVASEKNVNLNLLSKIEITLPPQTMAPVPNPVENPPVPQLPQLYVQQQKILYCVETQTCPEQQESTDEPIKPNISHPKKLDESKNDEWQTSPNESVTSKEHRLEWDSLADVGYSQEFQICDQSALSNTEKKAIKSYMRKQGLSSAEQIVIVKNSPGKQDDATPRQVRKRSLNDENWMEVYTKYKDKYATAPKFAPKSFQPDAQSTPMDAPRKKFAERITQTSLHDLQNKSVQVTPFKSMQDVTVHEPIDDLNKISDPEQVIEVVKIDEKSDQTSLESGSFTFIGPQKEKNEEILLKSPKKQQKTKGKLPKPCIQSSTDSSETVEDTSPPVDEELQMAIALMNSVLDSKTMKNAMKKSLIKKLMQKIFKLSSLDKSTEILTKIGSGSSTTISESTSYRKIKSFHADISPKTDEKEEKSTKTDASEEIPVYSSAENVDRTSFLLQNFVKETLKPMTHSEISYENHKSSSSTHVSSSTSANFASKESSSSTSTLCDAESMKRKLSQLLTIEKEIERLAQIKEKVQSEMRKTKSSKEKIYENVNFKEDGNKGRSRLGTPTSLSNDLVQRKENFMEQYVNSHGKLYDSVGTTAKSVENSEKSRKVSSRASSGTSRASSKPCFEPKKHTETQTTDSLRRISPYFENKIHEEAQKPQIINKTQINKQIQTTCQQAQAYSIVFDNKNSAPKENDERLPGQTLKEYLGEKRPSILKAMDERNECIKELRRLRQMRNEQRQKLLLLTSEACLKEKLRKLPPPPLAQKRLFSTRALKLHSLKQYQNLPEVQKKKEIEMLNNLKRKHRFLLDMFNKNLQQKVLQGKTDLSYNFNLFTNTH